MNLTLEEQETHFNIVASDRKTVEIYSDDPVYQRKLERIGATLVRTESSGKHYTLPSNQLSLRNPPKPRKPLTADEKTQLAARLAASRANP